MKYIECTCGKCAAERLEWMSVAQIAEYVGISVGSVYRRKREGMCPVAVVLTGKRRRRAGRMGRKEEQARERIRVRRKTVIGLANGTVTHKPTNPAPTHPWRGLCLRTKHPERKTNNV